MDTQSTTELTLEAFATRLDDALASVAPLAQAWDAEGAFVTEGVEGLRRAGALAVPLPPDVGGLGLGTTPAGARGTLELLRRIGRVSISLGRVFEGHVNALRLIVRYGTRMQVWHAAQDARAGHLFAIWAAEVRDTRVRMVDGTLEGRKAFASAARYATRAVITAEVPDEGECLVLVHLRPGLRRDGPRFDLHGVRSAGTASVEFDGMTIEQEARIGRPGDYMRQPEISLGAWRTLAVQLGGLEALVAALRDELTARRRHGDPHQLARFGRLLVAEETVRLWVERAADLAEGEVANADDAANYVKLARIAVESACVEAIQLIQRAAGLSAFVRPSPIERLIRDLATYLRQPALDMVLDEAAAHFLARPLA